MTTPKQYTKKRCKCGQEFQPTSGRQKRCVRCRKAQTQAYGMRQGRTALSYDINDTPWG